MDLDRFNFRGLWIGLAGVAMAMAPAAVGDHLPSWLLFASALTGIGLGFVGCGVHYHDMFRHGRPKQRSVGPGSGSTATPTGGIIGRSDH